MAKFEILCVTMHQNDFSKIKEMNIHSDIVFANQCDHTSYEELEFENHKAKMISTNTRGVGKNRNLALTYATADYCLFGDDDVTYVDNVEELVVKEFEAHPDADVFIFNLNTNDEKRKQKIYPKTKKHGRFGKMPWGGCRIAVRLESVKKANIWFNTLFGGGCIFPSGEDSLWLVEAKRKGLKFYVSKEFVGTVSFEDSSWFTGTDERFYYGKGAFYKAMHPKTSLLWMIYFALKGKNPKITTKQKVELMLKGKEGYKKMLSYDEYIKNC